MLWKYVLELGLECSLPIPGSWQRADPFLVEDTEPTVDSLRLTEHPCQESESQGLGVDSISHFLQCEWGEELQDPLRCSLPQAWLLKGVMTLP